MSVSKCFHNYLFRNGRLSLRYLNGTVSGTYNVHGNYYVRNYSNGLYGIRFSVLRRSGLQSQSALFYGSSASDQTKLDQHSFSQDTISTSDLLSRSSTDNSLDIVRTLTQENLHTLGLGSYYLPWGWIQNLLWNLHSTTGLPWWEVIALSTLLIRICTLPIIVSSQRRAAAMTEYLPEMQKLTQKLEQARRAGDRLQMQMAAMELQHIFQEKHVPNMLRMLTPMLANGAIFTCYFFALRGMALKHVAGMDSEGALWFLNLTIPDPMMILPTMCALSMLLVMELGIESGLGAKHMTPSARWMLRMLPFGVLLFANHLPAAVMCYWFTSNIISLIVGALFRMAAIRRFLKLPPLPPKDTSISWQESWRLPKFARDYITAPWLLMRAGISKLRKSGKNSNARTNTSKKNDYPGKTN